MNCSNCGKPLLAGSTICPICGTNNEVINTQTNGSNVIEQAPITNNVQGQVIPPETLNNQNVINNTQAIEQVTNNQNYENMSTNTQVQEQGINSIEQVEASGFDDDNFVELEDDEEKITITEDMAPPSLAVEEENLAQGAGDLANDASVSTYSEEAEAEQRQEEIDEKTRQDERVDIAIPSVGAVTEVSMPSDGSAPEVSESASTVGENTSDTTVPLEDPGKKKKFKISLAKGSKSVPKTLMIVVAIIFLVIGVLVGKALFSKNYCSTNTGGNRSVVSNKKIKYVSDGKNNRTNIGGYTYKIPEQYTYDKSNGGLLVYGENDLFRIFIKTDDALYRDLTGAKNSIRASMQENQVSVSNVKELKANDVEFLVFETTTKLNNRMIAFAEASQDQVYYLEIVDANNGFDYDVLDIAADIIKNAEYEDVSSNMESIDITDVTDVSIKAALEYKNLVNR